MPASINEVLDVLRAYGIDPDDAPDPDLPDIGVVEEGETIYSTSIEQVFRNESEVGGDERFEEWRSDIERIAGGDTAASLPPPSRRGRGIADPPEPHCAWYCPIHFFGCSWGIYIRERCIFDYAREIARFVNWGSVNPGVLPFQQLLRSGFYALYLHEQFHHKVESLGFRLLIATGSDRYRPYKQNVYRRSYPTADCIEEGLANAESYRRLNEERYARRLDPPIRGAPCRVVRFATACVFGWAIPSKRAALPPLSVRPAVSNARRLALP